MTQTDWEINGYKQTSEGQNTGILTTSDLGRKSVEAEHRGEVWGLSFVG